MDKKLVIKVFKKRAKSNDKRSRVIVVTHNTCSVNGGYIYDKIGVLHYRKHICVCYLNLYKLGYWLNRGVTIKTKVSWLAGIIGKYESKLK